MARILGIESTCDETAAAVVIDGHIVQSNVVATQFELHAKYRGVVPEIASRAHIENILPVLKDAIGDGLADIEAVAVSHRPGLIGSLLIGVTAAKTLAWALDKPLIAIDHVQAHLYSVMLREAPTTPEFPAVGLVCSGGHTALYKLTSWTDVELIGSTIDDAVGEAYDKVAAILKLGYPGGPILDRLASSGNPKAIKFPRTLLDRESLDFSFSGLKTAVLYHVRGVPSRRNENNIEKPPPSEAEIHGIAASFQAACVDVIIEKLRRAADHFDARSIIVGGGVSANLGLRSALSSFTLPVFFPDLKYCTDNAAMIAGLGDVYWRSREFAPLDLDAITYSRFRPAARIGIAVNRIISPPPLPARPKDGNKGMFGCVLVVGGNDGMLGAPSMAGRSSLKLGAGLVEVAVPKSILCSVLMITPELIGIGLANTGVSRDLVEAADKSDTIVIGPGLGQSPAALARLQRLVKLEKPMVVDADGLNLLAKQKRWPKYFKAHAVLTPHPGEMKRLGKLFGRDSVPTDDAGRIEIAMQAATAFGQTIVLKGGRTVVTDGKRVYVNHTGDSSLSKAGTGDVLSGMVGTLLAQKMTQFDAACAAVHVHGRAGEIAGQRLGMRCVLAHDVIDSLPQAIGEYEKRYA